MSPTSRLMKELFFIRLGFHSKITSTLSLRVAEWPAFLGEALCFQRRLCGPWQEFHGDPPHSVCLPAGVPQRGPPQQGEPRGPHC